MVAQDLFLNAFPAYRSAGEVARHGVPHELLDQLAVGGLGGLLCILLCFRLVLLFVFVLGLGAALALLRTPPLLYFVLSIFTFGLGTALALSRAPILFFVRVGLSAAAVLAELEG